VIQRSGVSDKEAKLRPTNKVDELRPTNKVDEPSYELLNIKLEVDVSHETQEINSEHDRATTAVMEAMDDGDDLSDELAGIEKSRSMQLERNIARLKIHRKEVYLKAYESYKRYEKKMAELHKEISDMNKYILHTAESIEFITLLVTIIDSIKNKLLPKINENTVVSEKLDLTATIGVIDVGTPVSDRNLSGILKNLIKCYKGGDIGSFFHELINLFGMKNKQFNTIINTVDDTNKNWKAQNLIEKYLTKLN
jgi:hypothetical protein